MRLAVARVPSCGRRRGRGPCRGRGARSPAAPSSWRTGNPLPAVAPGELLLVVALEGGRHGGGQRLEGLGAVEAVRAVAACGGRGAFRFSRASGPDEQPGIVSSTAVASAADVVLNRRLVSMAIPLFASGRGPSSSRRRTEGERIRAPRSARLPAQVPPPRTGDRAGQTAHRPPSNGWGPGAGTSASARPQRHGHRLDRQQRRDIAVERVAAGEHRLDPAQRLLGPRSRTRSARRRPAPRSLASATGEPNCTGQHVPVEAREVGQRQVEGVALGAGRAALLPVLRGPSSRPPCRAAGGRPPRRPRRARRAAPRSPWRRAPRRPAWRPRSPRRPAPARPSGSRRRRRPAAAACSTAALRRAGPLVGGQPAGAADVPLGGAGGVRAPSPARCRPGAPADRRRRPPAGYAGEVAAAGADRGQHVLDGGRAQQPDGTGRGLLDRLEQHVARALGEAVGVLQDDHLPAAAGRATSGLCAPGRGSP